MEPKEPKGKKKPARYINGYQVFSKELREQLTTNSSISFGEIARIIGKKWSELDQKQKSLYRRKANKIAREQNKLDVPGKKRKFAPMVEGESDEDENFIDLIDEEEDADYNPKDEKRKSSRVKKSPQVYQASVLQKKPLKSQKSVPKAPAPRRIIRQDVDLHMSCDDEELSIAQKEAIAIAYKGHEKANDLIKEFRAGHILVPSSQPNTFLLTTSNTSQQQQQPPQQVPAKLTTANNNTFVTPEPVSTGSLPPPRPAQFMNKHHLDRNKSQATNTQADVILIGDNPAVPPAGMTSNIGNMITQSMPTMSGQPMGVTPQQVYKFVNVPTTVSPTLVQNHWALKPLMKVSPHQQSSLIGANVTLGSPAQFTQITPGMSVMQAAVNLASPGEDPMTSSNTSYPRASSNTSCPTHHSRHRFTQSFSTCDHRLFHSSKNMGNSLKKDEIDTSKGRQFVNEISYHVVTCSVLSRVHRLHCDEMNVLRINQLFTKWSQVSSYSIRRISYHRTKCQRLKRCTAKQRYISDSFKTKFRLDSSSNVKLAEKGEVLVSENDAVVNECFDDHSDVDDEAVDVSYGNVAEHINEIVDVSNRTCDNNSGEPFYSSILEPCLSGTDSDVVDENGLASGLELVELRDNVDEVVVEVLENCDSVKGLQTNNRDNLLQTINDTENVMGSAMYANSALEVEIESRTNMDDLDVFEKCLESQICGNGLDVESRTNMDDLDVFEKCMERQIYGNGLDVESRTNIDDLEMLEKCMESQMCMNSLDVTDLINFVDSFKDATCDPVKTKGKKCFDFDSDVHQVDCNFLDWEKKRTEIFNGFLGPSQSIQQVYVLQAESPNNVQPLLTSTTANPPNKLVDPSNKLDETYGSEKVVLSDKQCQKSVFKEMNEGESDVVTLNSSINHCIHSELDENDCFLAVNCNNHQLCDESEADKVPESDSSKCSEKHPVDFDKIKRTMVRKWYEMASKEDIKYMLVLSKEMGFTKTSKLLQVPKPQLLKWKRLLRKTHNLSKNNNACSNNVRAVGDCAMFNQASTKPSQLSYLYPGLYQKAVKLSTGKPVSEVINVEKTRDRDGKIVIVIKDNEHREGRSVENDEYKDGRSVAEIDNVDPCVNEFYDERDLGAETVIETMEDTSVTVKDKKTCKKKPVSQSYWDVKSDKNKEHVIVVYPHSCSLHHTTSSVSKFVDKSVDFGWLVSKGTRNNYVTQIDATPENDSSECETDSVIETEDDTLAIPDEFNEFVEVERCRIKLEHCYDNKTETIGCRNAGDVNGNNLEPCKTKEGTEKKEGFQPSETKEGIETKDGIETKEGFEHIETKEGQQSLIYGIPDSYSCYDSHSPKDIKSVAVCQYCKSLVDLRELDTHDIFSTEFVKYILETKFFSHHCGSSHADLEYEASKVGEYFARGIIHTNSMPTVGSWDFFRFVLILQSKLGTKKVSDNFPIPKSTLGSLKTKCRMYMSKLCCLSNHIIHHKNTKGRIDFLVKMKLAIHARTYGAAKVHEVINVSKTTLGKWSRHLKDSFYSDAPVTEFTAEDTYQLIQGQFMSEEDISKLRLPSFWDHDSETKMGESKRDMNEVLVDDVTQAKDTCGSMVDVCKDANEPIGKSTDSRPALRTFPNCMEIMLEDDDDDDDYEVEDEACNETLLNNDYASCHRNTLGDTADNVVGGRPSGTLGDTADIVVDGCHRETLGDTTDIVVDGRYSDTLGDTTDIVVDGCHRETLGDTTDIVVDGCHRETLGDTADRVEDGDTTDIVADGCHRETLGDTADPVEDGGRTHMLGDTADRVEDGGLTHMLGNAADSEVESEDEGKLVIDEGQRPPTGFNVDLLNKTDSDEVDIVSDDDPDEVIEILSWNIDGLIKKGQRSPTGLSIDDSNDDNSDDDSVVSDDCDPEGVIEILSWNIDNESGPCKVLNCDKSSPKHNTSPAGRDSIAKSTELLKPSQPDPSLSSVNKFDSSVSRKPNRKGLVTLHDMICNTIDGCAGELASSHSDGKKSPEKLEDSVDKSATFSVKPKLTLDLNDVIYISDTEESETSDNQLLSPSEIKAEPLDDELEEAKERGGNVNAGAQSVNESLKLLLRKRLSGNEKLQECSDEFGINQLGLGGENDKSAQRFTSQSSSGNSNSGSSGSRENSSYSNNVSGNQSRITDLPHNVQIVGASELIPGEEYILLDPRVLSTRPHTSVALQQPRLIQAPLRKLPSPGSSPGKAPTPVHMVQNMNARGTQMLHTLRKPPPLTAYHPVRASLDRNVQNVQQSLLSGSIIYDAPFTNRPSVPLSYSVVQSSSSITTHATRVSNTATSTISSPIMNSLPSMMPLVLVGTDESGSHVAEQGSHMTQPESHVTQPGSHMSKPGNYVSLPRSHVTEPRSLVSRPESHVSQSRSHVSLPGSHVTIRQQLVTLQDTESEPKPSSNLSTHDAGTQHTEKTFHRTSPEIPPGSIREIRVLKTPPGVPGSITEIIVQKTSPNLPPRISSATIVRSPDKGLDKEDKKATSKEHDTYKADTPVLITPVKDPPKQLMKIISESEEYLEKEKLLLQVIKKQKGVELAKRSQPSDSFASIDKPKSQASVSTLGSVQASNRISSLIERMSSRFSGQSTLPKPAIHGNATATTERFNTPDSADSSRQKTTMDSTDTSRPQSSNKISSLIERMSSRISGQSNLPKLAIHGKATVTAERSNTPDSADSSRQKTSFDSATPSRSQTPNDSANQNKPKTASQILFGSSASPMNVSDTSSSLFEHSLEETHSRNFLNLPGTSGVPGKRDLIKTLGISGMTGKRDLRKSPITTRDIESSEDSDDETSEESSDESTASCVSSVPDSPDVCSNNSNNGGHEPLSAKLQSILNADIFTVVDSEDERADKRDNASDNPELSSIDPAHARQPVDRRDEPQVPPCQQPVSDSVVSDGDAMKKGIRHYYSMGLKKKLGKLCNMFSMVSIKKKYGINYKTLSLWKNKYQDEEVPDLSLTPEELNEIEEVKKSYGIVRKDDMKDYQIYVDNPEEEDITEGVIDASDVPSTSTSSPLKPEHKMPAWASKSKSKQFTLKQSVVNPLYISIEPDATDEMKSKVRNTVKNIPDNSKSSSGVFMASPENLKPVDKTDQPDHTERSRNKSEPDHEVSWVRTVYFCATEGVFKYKYEPKNIITVNESDKNTEQSVLESLFNKPSVEPSSRASVTEDRKSRPSMTTPSSSEIAEILRKAPNYKANPIKTPPATEKTADSFSEEFKSRVVSEAKSSGFENTARWYEVSIADIMKWHDSLLNENKHRNVSDETVVECEDDVQIIEPDQNEIETQSRHHAKLNSNLSFERIQVKEGTIKRPKFSSNSALKKATEPIVGTVPSQPKQFRTRMGPNSIKYAPRTTSDPLNQFQEDVQGDLGIMPKFVKQSVSKEKKDGVEIASTWKQVQSVINPQKSSDRKYTQDFKNKIIRECEMKGQKTVSIDHKIPYNEISRWRLEAKKNTPLPKHKPIQVTNKTDTAGSWSSTSVSGHSEVQPISRSSQDEVILTTEPESLKIKIKLSSISSLNQPNKSVKKQKPDKKSNSNVAGKKVEKGTKEKAAVNNVAQERTPDVPTVSGRKVRDSSLTMPTVETPPGPIDEDMDHRMEVINFCFEQGVLKTQKKYNVTRQSIIDLMKEYDELNKYAVDKYNQNQGFKTKLVSREKTSVEVTNTTTKPVIVKNLNDYIVTPEYMQTVVDYAVKHGITAASRKYKRKTSTVRSWINQFQKEEKKKISYEQVAKEQELLAANVSKDEAKKISVLEARRKRQLLEAEFRRHIIEFSREFGITAASRRFKKKASTVKSWMGHFAKSERDAKRQEGAARLPNSEATKGAKGSSETSSTSADGKVNSPPCSPIWEQDFFIKPSSSESPLKLTLSPRRKSVVLVDSSCEEDDTMDEETNDIETEDERESDFVELAAWEFKDSIRKPEKVPDNKSSKKAENLSGVVIDLISDEEKIEKPPKKDDNKRPKKDEQNEVIDITDEPSADDLDDANVAEMDTNKTNNTDSVSALANNVEVIDISELNRVENTENMDSVETIRESESIEKNQSVSHAEEKVTEAIPENAEEEVVVEEIPGVPYEDSLMYKVYTDEIDTFFLDKDTSVKYKVKKAVDKPLHTQSSDDNKIASVKKFKKYADAEIMQNIDETCLFNETRLTRNNYAKPSIIIEDNKKEPEVDKDERPDDKVDESGSDTAVLMKTSDEVGPGDSKENKIAENESNVSASPIKSGRSLFDILADESENSANIESDDTEPKSLSLFGNLMKSFKIPQSDVIQTPPSSEVKTGENIEKDSMKVPEKVDNVSEVENKPKDITERNLFDFIVPESKPTDRVKEENVLQSAKQVGSVNTRANSATTSKQKPDKSSDLLLKQRKPMFKFPKLASPFNFGNIAKLGMAKIKGENKDVDSANTVTSSETSNAISVNQANTLDKPKEKNSKIVKVDEPNSVVMETFEELRKRLAQERAAIKLLKDKSEEKSEESSVASKPEESVEKKVAEIGSVVESIQPPEEIDYEMYNDFTPQKIILILDISKKHGVDFASSSFGLPVSVIVNWIIEKDRKHRKVALSVSLEEKLRILERIKDDNKEEIAMEFGRKVTDFDLWEKDVGWMIRNKGVCDVLKKWKNVESVVSLKFEEKTKSVEKSAEKIDKVEKSKERKVDENLPVPDNDGVESIGDHVQEAMVGNSDADPPVANMIADPDPANEVPGILDFVHSIRPRDFTVEQKSIIVLLSDKYGSCCVCKKTGVYQSTLFNWRRAGSGVRQFLLKQSGQKIVKKKPRRVLQPVSSSTDTLIIPRETRSSATRHAVDDKVVVDKVAEVETKVVDKVAEAVTKVRHNTEDSDDETEGRKGYRVISPSKLPSVLKNVIGVTGKDYTLEQRVAIVKLVELYGVRTIHKQFRIAAGSIWNWQQSKAVTQQLNSGAVEESDNKSQKDEMDVDDEDKLDQIEEPFSIDSVLDRSLIVSDSVNHLNFQADQKADIVCLIQHFGCDYVCEKMPQIPRGTLWNWRHNKSVLTLVEKLNSKVNKHSKKPGTDSVIEEDVNKTDLTQKWLKELQDTTLGRKRKAGDDSDVKAKVKKNSQEFDCPSVPAASKGLTRTKPKIGPKCSKKKPRSPSPSTMCSELSVHSNDFDEIVSDEEHDAASKKSTGSSIIGNPLLKGSSPSKSDVSGELDAQNVKFEIVNTEIEDTSSRMMVCYKQNGSSGLKRPSTGESPPVKKKVTKSGEKSAAEKLGSENWIPLDEYFYGTNEGDASYTEEKGEYRFKCWYCSKMLYNNVRAMQHIQGHIDASKQQNIDLSDLTQCKHCYKQFDTPFDMQTHVEKVHLSNKVLMCRICEKDFPSQRDLMLHMKGCHRICEMPYMCQLCNFRSSMYSDVVDHFKKKHDSSHYLLCLYCLRSFEVKFVNQGWGQTQTYYGHLLKHQSKSSTKKCQVCRLTFFNSADVKNHRKNCHDHNPMNMQGFQHGGKSDTSSFQKKGSGLKSLNAPSISRIQDYGEIIFPAETNNVKCVECKMMMASTDHYKKYIHCTMCRFATSCSVAYANHMMGFHSGQMSSLNLNIPWERPMKETMYCICNFSSKYGNKMANHMVYCGKSTSYSKKPVLSAVNPTVSRTAIAEGDKQEGSLLDMLGLVQKKTVVPTTGSSEIHDSLKKETNRSEEDQSESMNEGDEIDRELKQLANTIKAESNLEDDTEEAEPDNDKPGIDNMVKEPADNVDLPEPVGKSTNEDVTKSNDEEGIVGDDDDSNKDVTEGQSHSIVAGESKVDTMTEESKDDQTACEKVSDSEDKESTSKVDAADAHVAMETSEEDDVAKETSEEVDVSKKTSDKEITEEDDTTVDDVAKETSEEDDDVAKETSEEDNVAKETSKESDNDEEEENEDTMEVEKTPEKMEEDINTDTTNTADDKDDNMVPTDTTEATDDATNRLEVETEEEKKTEVEGSGKEGEKKVEEEEELSSQGDDSKNVDTGDQAAKDGGEDEITSKEETKETPSVGNKDHDQGDKHAAGNHGNQRESSSHDRQESSERSDRHTDNRSHDNRRDNRSQGSSHRSDHGGRSYDQNRDRDRSYDRDRDYDRGRDRGQDRDRDRDRDYNRHRDYNRSSGYSHHDNRDRGYRGQHGGHQGQHGGYHGNRDYQDRNRGGHHQGQGYNRNQQNRGGYNQNYRGGHRGGYY